MRGIYILLTKNDKNNQGITMRNIILDVFFGVQCSVHLVEFYF